MGIWENYDFWRDSLLVLLISSVTLSFLGIWASLKKVVYQPLAISQIASLGVVVTFFIQDKFKYNITPEIGAIILASLMAFYFSLKKSGGAEAEVFLYLFSSSLVFILGNFIREDLHDVKTVLFGDSVLVEFKQVIYLLVVSIVIFLIYTIFYKKFLYISFDPDSAIAAGFKSYKYNVIIYTTFAIMISLSSSTIGGLPTFGIMIIPALSALNISKSMRLAFILSITFAVISVIIGYFLSFTQELPTGATIISITSVIYLITLLFKR